MTTLRKPRNKWNCGGNYDTRAPRKATKSRKTDLNRGTYCFHQRQTFDGRFCTRIYEDIRRQLSYYDKRTMYEMLGDGVELSYRRSKSCGRLSCCPNRHPLPSAVISQKFLLYQNHFRIFWRRRLPFVFKEKLLLSLEFMWKENELS